MNSGFQTIDLSKDTNIFGKAKSAFTLGLPVLIKTQNGVVSYGSVSEGEVESEIVYIINFVNDNKLYSETIAADNTVTESSIDVSGASGDIEDIITELGTITNEEETGRLDTLESDVEDIDNRVGANKMLVANRTLLDDYNDASDPTKIFTCPSDGYVNFKVQGTINNAYGVTVYDPGSAGAQACQYRLVNAVASDQFGLTFVRKGMRLICNVNVGTGNYGYFIPLEN